MKNWKDEVVCHLQDSFELGLIWSRGNSLQQIAEEILKRVKGLDFDYFGCVETKGIIFGSAVSAISGKELRIFRKQDRIQYTDSKYARSFLNWKEKNDGIEIEKEQISRNDKIVVIDDIVDTGITFENVNSIIREANAEIVKYVCIKNLSRNVAIDGSPIESILE